MTTEDLKDHGELLARLDERTAHLVSSVDWIRDQMASKAELRAAIAPVAKDLTEHKVETGHRFDKLETRQDLDHQRLIFVTIGLVIVLGVALGMPKLVGWLGVLIGGGA